MALLQQPLTLKCSPAITSTTLKRLRSQQKKGFRDDATLRRILRTLFLDIAARFTQGHFTREVLQPCNIDGDSSHHTYVVYYKTQIRPRRSLCFKVIMRTLDFRTQTIIDVFSVPEYLVADEPLFTLDIDYGPRPTEADDLFGDA